MHSRLNIALSILMGWMFISGIIISYGFVFIDIKLSLIVGVALMMISLFSFTGYLIGKNEALDQVLNQLNDASGEQDE